YRRQRQMSIRDSFKRLIKRPKIAWPTIMLLVSAYGVFGLTVFAYVEGILPLIWAILFNTIASYMAFTVAHDATHSAISSNRWVNDWAGRAGIALLEPTPVFLMFRYIHMQHHKFTNDEAKDPDAYCGTGPTWLLPFKWLTLDFVYFREYLKPEVFRRRPKKERREFYLAVLFGAAVIAAITLAGWLGYFLLLYFVPTRIAKLVVTFTFDFLPHYPHEISAKEDRFRSTSNRVGMEWLMTPIFLYQNYHLVHHLYPTVPFYRYLKIWNARRIYHETQNPAITDTFSLKPRGVSD
ncbi:fatty acid desaturase, partial [Sphingorhabdus sp. Alg239-R122]|uniref:fatty acid desaturase n=1 Tax=Sphingorhabdus sp. Alg239-R122 TaxID=2305989 RepID=UPI0019672B8E